MKKLKFVLSNYFRIRTSNDTKKKIKSQILQSIQFSDLKLTIYIPKTLSELKN